MIATRTVRRAADFLETDDTPKIVKTEQHSIGELSHYICTLSRGIEQCIFLLHVRLNNVNEVPQHQQLKAECTQ